MTFSFHLIMEKSSILESVLVTGNKNDLGNGL